MTTNSDELQEVINHAKAKAQLDKKVIQRRLKEEEDREKRTLKEVDDINTPNDIEELNKEAKTKEYARSRRSRFINDTLSKMVFSSPYSLILMAGRVGKGKSTTTANIIAEYISKKLKVLVISNEEMKVDVFDRVSCILKNQSFYKHSHGLNDNTEKEIIKECREFIGKNNLLKVVGLDYRKNPDYVTSVNGVTAIVDKAVENYDVVIVDYYQKITKDTASPSKSLNDIQNEMALNLDALKNKAHRGPIIVFSQMWGETTDRKDFEQQIKGRKTIFDVCTGAYEIVPNKPDFLTAFVCRKDRWDGTYEGFYVKMGFHKELCTFIENYDSNPEFLQEREKWKAERSIGDFKMIDEDEDE